MECEDGNRVVKGVASGMIMKVDLRCDLKGNWQKMRESRSGRRTKGDAPRAAPSSLFDAGQHPSAVLANWAFHERFSGRKLLIKGSCHDLSLAIVFL